MTPLPALAVRLVGHSVTPGKSWPMGATFDGDGVNFAVFSANAERIELCLFSGDGRKELARIALPERDGDVWHGHVGGLTPGSLYGYRAYGPYAPEQGHRFNPNKLLIDPYAGAVMIAAAALPVAGNVFILAQHYGVAPARVSAAILISTGTSVATVTVVLALVRFGMGIE